MKGQMIDTTTLIIFGVIVLGLLALWFVLVILPMGDVSTPGVTAVEQAGATLT